jgi:hypothetical protein
MWVRCAFSHRACWLDGAQAVAVAMSDPFGDDDIDFELETFLKGAYDNAVALITDERPPMANTRPADMDTNFPLADSPAAIGARTFATAFDEFGNKRSKPVTTPTGTPKSATRQAQGLKSITQKASSASSANGYKRLDEKQQDAANAA